MERRTAPLTRDLRKRSLVCSVCGYGIACRTPPELCPMCLREGTWVHPPWRPFGHAYR